MGEAEQHHDEMMARIIAEHNAQNRLQDGAPVTKAILDCALEEWKMARDKAAHEQLVWAGVLQSHAGLIESLRVNGHTKAAAEEAFRQISIGHQEALVAAWKHMDVLCCAYQALLERFEAEQGLA
jgi:hypothetical protein